MSDFLNFARSAHTKANDFDTLELLPFQEGFKLRQSKGIYALYERTDDNTNVVYVGRTRNLAGRFRAHVTPNHNSASFALKRTRIIHGLSATYKSEGGRLEIATSQTTRPTFLEEITKIKLMSFRFMRVENPVDQYLIELALTMKFGLPLDGFDSH